MTYTYKITLIQDNKIIETYTNEGKYDEIQEHYFINYLNHSQLVDSDYEQEYNYIFTKDFMSVNQPKIYSEEFDVWFSKLSDSNRIIFGVTF